jgi:hypothetical protein
MSSNKRLYLYEALELRGEYDGRIKTLKDCLPESKQNRDRLVFRRDEGEKRRPSPDFDVADARKQLAALEFKRRKINSAIQKANFNYLIEFRGESINLNEALELRKSFNERIGELHSQAANASYQRVIYKEGRDIVEENEVSYSDSIKALDDARLSFRELNRKIRLASFELYVDFIDE